MNLVTDPTTGRLVVKTNDGRMLDPTTGQEIGEADYVVRGADMALNETLAQSIEQTSPQLAEVIRQNSARGGNTGATTTATQQSQRQTQDDLPQRRADPIPPQGTPSINQTQLAADTGQDNQGNIEALRELLGPLLDPSVINTLEENRAGRQQRLAQTYGDLARKRDIEMQNIRSWQAIQQAQIQKEAVLASTLANTAYLAHTPNASVIQALQVPMQTAANAFK